MIPRRIALKNFLSFGELPDGKPIEFIFTDGDPLWVLCGANGAGKSAVFDAITYALYGRHRGGEHKAEQLIRHNTNSFEVEFDFAFNGADYRIRRTRSRKGVRTTQHLLRRVDGEWKCIRGNDPAGAVKADDIESWVKETLGLNFDSFTNSVLLQQGKADKLFSASRDERIDVLKGIIGFEQYEALSDRIGTETKSQGRLVEGLLAKRNAIPEVLEEELKEARAAVDFAQAAAAGAQDALAAANTRVAHARQWERLHGEREGLDGKLAAAEEREKQGRRIREDKQALDDLAAAVPVLRNLLALRGRIANLDREAQRAAEDVEKFTAQREAARAALETTRDKARRHKEQADERQARVKSLAGEIERSKGYLTEAEAIAELDRQLDAFPADLDSQLTAEAEKENHASDTLQVAKESRTRARTLLEQTEQQRDEYARLKEGAECPHCRQPVDSLHAAKIRNELAAEVVRLQEEAAKAEQVVKSTQQVFEAARKERIRLEGAKNARDSLTNQRDTRRQSLAMFGAAGDLAQLRAQLVAQEKERDTAEAQRLEETKLHTAASAEGTRLEKEFNRLAEEVGTAEGRAAEHRTALATARGQEEITCTQLSEPWRARLPEIDNARVESLAADLQRLEVAGVAEQFRLLNDDATLRGEWESRRKVVAAEMETIPETDRISEAGAKERLAAAQSEASDSAETHRQAVLRHDDLVNRENRREALTREHRDAAERHRLLKKLGDLLGDTGLQLELVRDAEEQIVAFANETLQHLSDGDLSLEEDTAPDTNRTFDLRVRRSGGEPIGVAFLSGSQRFRVAVAIALAVGRFASGRTRALESVIIDEGFGSLDPEGLQAMATELKRLQQTRSLQRVILVSHQPDFTEQFSVGYTLSAGENGTMVSAFRR